MFLSFTSTINRDSGETYIVMSDIGGPQSFDRVECVLLRLWFHVIYFPEDLFPQIVNFEFPAGVFQAMSVSLHRFKVFFDKFHLVPNCSDSQPVCRIQRMNSFSLKGLVIPGSIVSAVLKA